MKIIYGNLKTDCIKTSDHIRYNLFLNEFRLKKNDQKIKKKKKTKKNAQEPMNYEASTLYHLIIN